MSKINITKNITIVISSLGSGGAERVAVGIANKFSELGMKVTVITLSKRKDDFYSLSKSVNRIAFSSEKSKLKLSVFKKIKQLYILRKTIILDGNTTVISFMPQTNIKVLLALIFSKTPVIVTEHADPLSLKKNKVWNLLRYLTYPFSKSVISVSRGISDYFWWIKKSKKTVINNPLTKITFYKDSITLSEKLNKPGDSKFILSMGRLEYIKGFDILIKSFSEIAEKLPNWNLVILGDGPEKNNLLKIIKELRLENRVFLLGNIKEPFTTMKNADIFALTSRNEGFGNVIIEAMACDLPVISLNSIGPSEIIQHNFNGILVENKIEFAGALELLIKSEKVQKRIVKNAKDELWKYNIEHIISLWLKEIR